MCNWTLWILRAGTARKPTSEITWEITLPDTKKKPTKTREHPIISARRRSCSLLVKMFVKKNHRKVEWFRVFLSCSRWQLQRFTDLIKIEHASFFLTIYLCELICANRNAYWLHMMELLITNCEEGVLQLEKSLTHRKLNMFNITFSTCSIFRVRVSIYQLRVPGRLL